MFHSFSFAEESWPEAGQNVEDTSMGAQPRLALFVEEPQQAAPSAADSQEDFDAWLQEAAGWSVREAYERGKKPELDKAKSAKSTYQGYNTHLRRWGEFWAARASDAGPNSKYRSTGPILGEVKRRDLEDWRGWLLETLKGGNVPHNANKHVKSIQAVLQWAEGKEIIPRAATLEQLSANTVAAKLYFRYDEIDRLYQGCNVLHWPIKTQRGAPLHYAPARYWRAAMVLFFYYGFRTQELLRWESDHQTLCWRNIWWGAETPAEDGHARNEHGWLWYVPQKQAKSKPEPVVLPLTAITAAHLRSIEPPNGVDPERPIFDWPFSADSLYGQWDLLCQSTAVRPKPRLGAPESEQPKYLLLHWRKTCSTWCNAHRPGLGPLVTGHADRELTRHARASTSTLGDLASAGSLSAVNAKHYDHSGELAVVEGLNTMPVPESFRSIFDMPGEVQRSLFQ